MLLELLDCILNHVLLVRPPRDHPLLSVFRNIFEVYDCLHPETVSKSLIDS